MLFFWIFATKGKCSHEIKLWAQTKLVVGQFGVAEFNAHVFGVVGNVLKAVGGRKTQKLLEKVNISVQNTSFGLKMMLF